MKLTLYVDQKTKTHTKIHTIDIKQKRRRRCLSTQGRFKQQNNVQDVLEVLRCLFWLSPGSDWRILEHKKRTNAKYINFKAKKGKQLTTLKSTDLDTVSPFKYRKERP